MQRRSQKAAEPTGQEKHCRKDLGKGAADSEWVRDDKEEKACPTRGQNIQKSEICKREMKGEAAVLVKRMLFQSSREAWSFTSRMVATQARQQLSFLPQQHQVPATPMHRPEGGEGGDENESREMVSQRQRARSEGFPAGSGFGSSKPQAIQVKVTGGVLNSPREGAGERGRKFRKERSVDPSNDSQGRSRSPLRHQQQSRGDSVPKSGGRVEREYQKRKAIDREGTREPQQKTARETGVSTSPPWDQGGRKQVRCIPQEGSLKNEEKRWWRQSPAERRDEAQGRKKGGRRTNKKKKE